MMRSWNWLLTIALIAAGSGVIASDQYESSASIATVDGKPVYVGELNLVLVERLGLADFKQVSIDLQQATALLLVRRHLAMKTLIAVGGPSLESMIQQRLETFTEQLNRRQSSLSKYAASRMADERSLTADLSWKVAWEAYLKRHMTEENLRRFFDMHRDRYGGGSYDELTDQAKLRRDATNAMFDSLVQKQRDSAIQWFIPALRPPEQVPVVP